MNLSKMGKLVTKAAEGKMYSCKTIPPFNYYVITLDEAKLTIVHHQWFVKHILTIQLVDLLNVEILIGPVFGSARVFSKYVTGGEMTIPWFMRKDAITLRSKINDVKAELNNPDQSGGQ